MDVRGYIEANSREYFDALKQWLAIPSISADPARRGDVRAVRRMAGGARLRATGFPVAEVWETGSTDRRPRACPRCSPSGPPTTRPRRPCSSTATTTCSRSSRWRCGTARRSSPPSATASCSARGASDDKGQVLFHLLGLRACLAAGRPPTAPRRSRSSC